MKPYLPLALLLPLCATACAPANVPRYRVQTASASNITILIDPALRNLPAAERAAAAHCAGFGKTAVQLGIGKPRGGLAPVSFACRPPGG
ncbi:hypothetical protein [Acidisoma sp. C75]